MSKEIPSIPQISKAHQFGSVAWQEAMLDRIERMRENNFPLGDGDIAFLDTQKAFVYYGQEETL